MQKLPDFLNKPAPPNYVAGLGRGATGFTTRSDIGPAREQVADSGAADGQEDKFTENEEGLLGTGPYDEEDEEADRIYADIESKMDERRKAWRETREREDAERHQKVNPKIHEQFADAKYELSKLSEDDWSAIPEAGAISRRQKKTRDPYREQAAPVSDLILARAHAQTQKSSRVESDGAESTFTDFYQVNKARDDLLKVRLDQAASHDSESGKTTVDPKGYLTDLGSMVLKTEAEIGDIKKARELLKSVTATNPKHAPGWIAAARVEEIDGKISKARSIISRGCDECPTNEDVWVEAVRLNTEENAKIILANAVRNLPESVKLWMEAVRLEKEVKAKRRVLRKAIELIPNSVNLWKAAIEMEDDPEDAKILLSRAVECVPISVELWVALARLESYENAKKILNRARIACPLSAEIWINAARLEESASNMKNVDAVIRKAIVSLSAKGGNLSRESWIKQAEECENLGSPVTCQAIINNAISQDLEDEDRREQWSEDADASLERGCILTARAILAFSLSIFGDDDDLWRQAADLEKSHGTPQTLDDLLQKAVQSCPHAEVLWQMGAKERWIAGDIDGARAILMEAFRANPNSESIWLAAAKLEIENGEFERGRFLLGKARELANTERVWLKSAILERNLGNDEAALQLLREALAKFPLFSKFYLMKSQIEQASGKETAARETLTVAIKNIPKDTTLWVLSARLETLNRNFMRARAILDKAKLINPKSEDLWLESIRLERLAENPSQCKIVLAKALQECPSSGRIWCEAIFMEPKASRKSRITDALKKCESNPYVLLAGAKLFWMDRNMDKARTWFQRAVKADPSIGDIWAWWYKFEILHGTEKSQLELIQRMSDSGPRYGEEWCAVSKQSENWRMSIVDILKTVSKRLSDL